MTDMYSRECLDIHVDKSITGEMVAGVLNKLKASRGLPKRIKADRLHRIFVAKMLTKHHGSRFVAAVSEMNA